MRLLSVVRLSDITDATTSPERQREKNAGYASLHGHEIMGVAEDLDVSGAVRPFDRPELGPWLTDPEKVGEWDALIVAKLDRLTRSLFDFLDLWHWLSEHGKSLVCIEPSLDMTTPAGRAFAQVIAVFAEFERETIRARVKDAYDALRQAGSYPGMTVPFGYMPLKREGKGWEYIPDPDYAPLAAEMADRLLAGGTLNGIARWLNDEKIPAPRNIARHRANKRRAEQERPLLEIKESRWTGATVRKILGSYNLVGATMADGQPVRETDGSLKLRSEPLIDMATFDRVRQRLAMLSDHVPPRVNSSPLLQVVFCAECASPMYITFTRRRGRLYRYYHCAKAHVDKKLCGALRVKADDLEMIAEWQLLDKAGDVRMVRRKVIPAKDSTGAIALLQDQIGALAGRVAVREASGLDVTEDNARIAEAKKTLTEVVLKGSEPARVEDEQTSETFSERWAGMDWKRRNVFLRERGFAMLAGQRYVVITSPETDEAIREAASIA